jgi:DNA-binding response OmpR family regulator
MKRPYHILLLEDEPLLRGVLALYLTGRGFKLLAAGDPQDAETLLRVVGWRWPDLVLSDANLGRDPERLDGYLFHARWRARYPVPPFVFMEGSRALIRLPGEDSCRVRHITKPFAPGELLEIIRSLLA